MSSEKRKANKSKSVEELFSLVGKELKDLRIRDILEELQPLWKHTKPKCYSELTEAERKAYDKEQVELQQELEREQRILKIKQFLQTIIKAKSNDPDSKLFRTAEELLEFVVRYESNPSSVSNYEWNRFETILLTRCEALLQTEVKEKPEETEQDATFPKRKKEGWLWMLYEKTLKVIIDAVLDKVCPK